MLDLEEVREEFSRFLAEDPRAKLRLDAALGRVALMCYERGAADAKSEQLVPHKYEYREYGYALTEENGKVTVTALHGEKK